MIGRNWLIWVIIAISHSCHSWQEAGVRNWSLELTPCTLLRHLYSLLNGCTLATFFVLSKNYVYIMKKQRDRDRSRWQTEVSLPVVHSPSACNTWDRSKLNLRARNSVQVSHIDGRDPRNHLNHSLVSSRQHPSGKLESGQELGFEPWHSNIVA